MKFTDIFKREKRNKPTEDTRNLVSYGSYSVYDPSVVNPTVSAVISLISFTVAKLPLELKFMKNDNSPIKAGFHVLYPVLNRKPNDEETIFTFKSRLMRYLLENGNAFVWKSKDTTGSIDALYLLNPAYVTIKRVNGKKVFFYDGKQYSSDVILHIPALIYDGLIGHSPLASAKWAVEMGNMLDQFSKKSITQGMNVQVFVDANERFKVIAENKGNVTDELNNIDAYYTNRGSGTDNAKGIITNYPDTKPTVTNLSSNKDAELQASRQFQIEEICKVFNLQLAMLQGNTTDIEATTTKFLSDVIQPWVVHIEQYLNLLLTDYEQERYYFEFDTENVTLELTATRTARNVSEIQNGISTINDVLKRAGRPIDTTEVGNTRFFNGVPYTEENLKAIFATAKLSLEALKHNPIGDEKN